MLYGPITLTSDAAGTATYTSNDYLEGRLQCIYVAYDAAAPGGTDFWVYDATKPAPAVGGITYLAVINNNVNGVYFPRIDCCDNAGNTVFYDPIGAGNQVEVRDCYYMANPITIDIAGLGAAGRTVTFYIYYSDFK